MSPHPNCHACKGRLVHADCEQCADWHNDDRIRSGRERAQERRDRSLLVAPLRALKLLRRGVVALERIAGALEKGPAPASDAAEVERLREALRWIEGATMDQDIARWAREAHEKGGGK